MQFKRHLELGDRHAFLSPSSYHWLNYSEEKLEDRFTTAMAARRGSELHEFASEAIRLGIKLPANKSTLNQYVNDAIGYRMEPEQVLYYSDNCFGTADAIAFRRNKLRIHDLKTGMSPTSEKQLEIYAALFCLEYGYKPFDITTELRIYQSDEVRIYDADPGQIVHIMDKIMQFDIKLDLLRDSI